jgi:SnoaL-like domain
MTTNTTRTAVGDLVDKQAITEVLYRYCRGCDRADEAAIRSCFHPGSLHRHGGFEGTSADFTVLAMKIILGTKLVKHLLTNVLIELNGEQALSESHYFAYHRQVDPQSGAERDYFTGGRFLDRFQQRAGDWKIVQRLGLIDFERHEAPDPRGQPPASQMSQRFPNDELYRNFMLSANARRNE